MKRLFLYPGSLVGSVIDWPVEYSISRNEKTKVWTLYVQFTDPEARDSRSHHLKTPQDFLEVMDEEYMDPEEFCDALESDGAPALDELAKEIRRLKEAAPET